MTIIMSIIICVFFMLANVLTKVLLENNGIEVSGGLEVIVNCVTISLMTMLIRLWIKYFGDNKSEENNSEQINQSVSANTSRKIQFCSNCGAKLISNSKFCSKCGSEIEKQ